MNKSLFTLTSWLLMASLVAPIDVFGRGFGGGRGGGGGFSRGGGGARPGGGGISRPSGGARPQPSRPPTSHTGSFSRPGGGSQPSIGGGGRPSIGGGGHPSIGGGSRPGIGGGGLRPSIGGGNSPGIANRPGAGGGGVQNPLIANRPSIRPGGGGERNPFINNRPDVRPGAGGGGVQNPILANRPDIRPGAGGGGVQNPNFDNRPGVRPGAGGGGVQNPIFDNRPGIRPGGGGAGERNPFIANLPGIRPGGGGAGERFPNLPDRRPGWEDRPNRVNIGNDIHINNINNNNFISNRTWNSNWHHGNWNGNNWNGNWNRPGGGGWWNGYAHGYRDGYWDRPWYAQPVAWGMGAWAMGSIFYNSGYATYSNPYYAPAASTEVYYDYSQPIQVVSQSTMASVDTTAAPADPGAASPAAAYPPAVQEGTSHGDMARDAFDKGDYAGALKEIDLALQKLPNDAALHELRALVQFAMKDYQSAAATLYAVLSAGPGWDWTTLSSLYPNVDAYTEQVHALEEFVKLHPEDPAGHFVLAYHYLTQGHNDPAVRQLRDVVRLQPSDQLAKQLLSMIGGNAAPSVAEGPPPAATLTADPPNPSEVSKIDAKQIVGNWTTERADGTTFALTLTVDDKFTWAYSRGGRKGDEFGGAYAVDGAVLVLSRADGAQMPGLVTVNQDGFNFKLYGGPENDPGLDFKKS